MTHTHNETHIQTRTKIQSLWPKLRLEDFLELAGWKCFLEKNPNEKVFTDPFRQHGS